MEKITKRTVNLKFNNPKDYSPREFEDLLLKICFGNGEIWYLQSGYFANEIYYTWNGCAHELPENQNVIGWRYLKIE